jgi:hypothetical protein
MTIKVIDLPLKFKAETRCFFHTYWTCQKSIASPSLKNIVHFKIMDRPQIRNSMVEFFSSGHSHTLQLLATTISTLQLKASKSH